MKIRKDLEGVVYLDDGRKLAAGDTIPDDVYVGDHLLSDSDARKRAEWFDAEEAWKKASEAAEAARALADQLQLLEKARTDAADEQTGSAKDGSGATGGGKAGGSKATGATGGTGSRGDTGATGDAKGDGKSR